jgi:hypothetical protein
MRQNIFVLMFAVIVASGCATHIRPTVTSNPPPTRALNAFGFFEVQRLTADDGVKEPDAMVKIQQNCDGKLNPLLASWNRGTGRTLVIEPRVRELKFVSGANRVLAGAMAGSSAIRMTVKLTDKSSGAVIAEPEFYQRAAAWGAAYTFGVNDNNMLSRICAVLDEYLRRNYTQAVGGPTGFEQP